MSYLVAERCNEECCFAVCAISGKGVAELDTLLGRKLLSNQIEIFTVSSMEMLNEYAPYHLLDDILIFQLTAIRVQAGLSMKELAQKSGIPEGTISQIENGSYDPPASDFCRLINCLGYKLHIFKENFI